MVRFEILEDDEQAIKEFHKKGWVSAEVEMTSKDIESLQKGKVLGYDDSECTHIIRLVKE